MSTYLEDQESLSSLLERAAREGAVRIQRPDGRVFVLEPESTPKSPLDVPGIDLQLDAQQIVEFIHAGRREQP